MRKMTAIQRSADQRGAVLITMIVLVMTMSAVTLILMETSADVAVRAETHKQDVRLRAVADAAIDLSMHHLWNRYNSSLAAGEGNSLKSFRTFLDALEIPSWNAPVAETGEFHIFGDMTYNEPEWVNLHTVSGLPDNKKNKPSLDGVHVHGLELLREDGSLSTALRVRAWVSLGSDPAVHRQESTERVFFVTGGEFSGFEYALLANNVNCIMCHARVDSVERYYNTDPAKRGTFDRVRAGTMESLKIRAGKADSQVAGAFYTRGPVMNKDGTLLAGLAGSELDSAEFDADGHLAESGGGALTLSTFVNASGNPLPAGENLYLNYPLEEDDQVDGPMPAEFPPVIPDTNKNRRVDDAEFLATAESAEGSITGGLKVFVGSGGSCGGAGLPGSDGTPTLTGRVDGHVIVIGTAAKPIVLNGKVAVDGDVIIGGVVKGSGTIIARNNVYIVGSLKYADGVNGSGKRTFGTASDGRDNRLTLTAGGNILVGNFLLSKNGALIDGTEAGEFSFTMSEVTLFNQMEWTKTQATLPDSGGDPVANPLYNPDYVPRYYTIRDDNQAAIFNKEDTYFNAPTRTWLGKEHLSKWDMDLLTMLDQADVPTASFVSFMPQAAWVDPAQLIAMWDSMDASHSGGPFAIDAFLYTSNAIMLLTRKSSVYSGQALVNGGIVAADLGILVPGTGGVGLQLNYDDRHKGIVNLREAKEGNLRMMRGARLR